MKYEPTRLDIPKCEWIVKKCQVSLRGWNYPHYHESGTAYGGITAGLDFIQCITNYRQYKELWRRYQTGQFFHRFGLVEDWLPQSENESVLFIHNTLYIATEIYEFASRLAQNDVFGDSFQVDIRLRNLTFLDKSRRLTFKNSNLDPSREYYCSENSLPFSETLSKAKILAEATERAINYTRWVFERFHWFSPNVREILSQEQDNFVKGNF